MQMYTKNVYQALLDVVERITLEHRGPFYMSSQRVLEMLLKHDLPFTEKEILKSVEAIERKEARYHKKVAEVYNMIDDKQLYPSSYEIASDIFSLLEDENLVANYDNIKGMHESLFD